MVHGLEDAPTMRSNALRRATIGASSPRPTPSVAAGRWAVNGGRRGKERERKRERKPLLAPRVAPISPNRDKRPLRPSAPAPLRCPYDPALEPPNADRTPPAERLHCGLISPQIGLKTPRFGPELASFAPAAQE